MNCKNCDKPIPVSNISKLTYCSKQCRKDGRIKSLQGRFESKNCIICGSTYLPISSIQLCCSDPCKNEHRKLYMLNFNSKFSDFSIYHRDNFRCIYCGKSSIEDGVKLHIDHIIAISKSGKTELDNLVTSCVACNLSKSNNLLNNYNELRIRNVIKLRNDALSKENANVIMDQVNQMSKVR